MYYLSVLSLFALVTVSLANIYFREDFDSASWSDRWVQSVFPGKEFGKFEWTAGEYFGDADKDKGIKTSEDARFYGISSKFADSKFNNANKDLVIQFSVKHEQNIDCGGGYLKVFDCDLDQAQLHGDSKYQIMFGPDICGPGTKKVHVIFNYKGKNLLINKEIKCKDDVNTHLYKLVVKPDNTYTVSIDNEVVEKGELEKDWSFLEPKKIKDPEAKKPEDWDDRAKIPDPEDKKPEEWDQPAMIPDPAATKPDDWDDEMDGAWEPPNIDNPAFKGEWKPKEIDNPNYKGPWIHPEIDNPEYVADDKLYNYDVCAVGFDLWQVKAGTIFDNVLIGDDEKEADEIGKDIIERAERERKAREEGEEKKRKETEAAEEAKKDAEVDKEEEDDDKEKIDDEEQEKDDKEDTKHEEL